MIINGLNKKEIIFIKIMILCLQLMHIQGLFNYNQNLQND